MFLGKLNIDSIDISQLKEFEKNLEKMPKEINRNVRVLARNFVNTMRTNLVVNTPAAPGSGEMRRNWRVTDDAKGEGVIFSTSIHNRNLIQASAVELGSAPLSSPWPYPTKGRGKLPGRKNKPERTVLSKGRIWSTQAVGGVTPKVVRPGAVIALCREIANSIVATVVK